MQVVYFDCETYSEASLKGPQSVGAYEYARHPSTRVLLWTFYVRGSAEVHAVEGQPDLAAALAVLPERVSSPALLIHWGPFDRFIAEAKAPEGSPFRRYAPTLRDDTPQAIWYGPKLALFDLSQHCLQAGGPAKLEHAAEWVGSNLKLPGQALIRLFCEPHGPRVNGRDTHPQEWQDFVTYAAQDARALSDIAEHLGPFGSPEAAQEGWRVVERMNARGLPIDTRSVMQARRRLEEMEPAIITECERVTGGLRPTQAAKLAKFWGLPNAQRPTLEAYLERPNLTRAQRRSAEIRLEVSGATRHKLAPMLNQAGHRGRVRYQFLYYGAWTRRLTARGVQPQNFFGSKPREEFFEREIWDPSAGVELFEQTKQNIRGFIQAPPGRLLVSADFAQIELRVLAWLAGEDWVLDALRGGRDVYKETAAAIYGLKSPDAVTPEQRSFGKMVELASGFGLSGTGRDGDGGLFARAQAEGIALGRAEAERAIAVYRRTHPATEDFWAEMNRAAIRCVRTGRDMEAGRIGFEMSRDDVLRVIRPSGQFQCLWSPRVKPSEFGKDQLEYIGRDKVGQMRRGGTYGGRLAQGVTQGTAADLLLAAMRTAEQMGYPPIMSIHDEIVSEIDDDGAQDHAEKLCAIFTSQLPAWAEGLPVAAEGWQHRRFRK